MKRLAPTLFLAAAAVAAVGLQMPAGAEIGTLDAVPAATLLLPYFEVGGPAGANTQVLFGNASAVAGMAHVTLWTELGLPTLTFDIPLSAFDSDHLDLRLIFAGVLPKATVGLMDQRLNAAAIAALLNAHTGVASTLFGGQCGGLAHGDGIARGFLTIDAVVAPTSLNPSDDDYFDTFADTRNYLFGTYESVEQANNLAFGDTLVHVEASSGDPRTDGAGDYTFYGRLSSVGGTGVDHREGLPTTWMSPYYGGVASTALIVWRDAWPAAAIPCGTTPAGLSEAQVVDFDEEENAVLIPAAEHFPLASGRVEVGSAELPVVYSFGFLYLNLQRGSAEAPFGTLGQAHVSSLISAFGILSGGHTTWPLDNVAMPPAPLFSPLTSSTATDIGAADR